ncbi:MAG: anthranilate synthase component I [Fusicatenibacter sp.]|nr:anthranilate synthase component I [Lachnospiraceae bacterium]MDY2938202.1 anthranilate synthase component I [Fusicatenibacter sp.]
MKQTTYEEIQTIAASGRYRKVPVSREMYSDIRTPIEVLRILQENSGHCFMLESAEDRKQWGRYTFLGYDPALEVTCTDGELILTAREEILANILGEKMVNPENLPSGQMRVKMRDVPPGEMIEQILEANRSPRIDTLPTFTGGLVGYFSYDYIKYSEPSLKLDAADEEQFKDVDLMLFDKVIAYDNFRQKIILMVNMETKNLEAGYQEAVTVLDTMEKLIRSGKAEKRAEGHLRSEFRPLFSEKEYCEKVEQVKHYIHEGDLFQLVLSNRLEADFEGSLLDTYRVLRTTNPSPYMFYFCSEDVEIAGASPETLVKVENDEIRTFPLAGTRPRGKNSEQDAALERELLSDEKECAEHNMLVDLGRNDLGKLCRFGSVEVEKYMFVERYSHVMHIGSTVKGQLREDAKSVDAIASVLPAGTLSGAPKIRACQIIQELEGNKRGIYGGAIGYLDFTGNLDTCIAIRLAFKKNGKLYVRSGAGIVADSVPEKEYQECINKAKAVLQALKEAEGGMDL